MRFYIDSADIEQIQFAYDHFDTCGVTTNPSILYRNGKDPKETLLQIRRLIGEDELFVQTVASDAQQMIQDGRAIADALGSKTIIKIPATAEGFKAINQLKSEGLRTAATTIYFEQQAFLAMAAGAEFIIPYFSRISAQGFDAAEKITAMKKLMASESAKLFIASFKTAEQVVEALQIDPFGLTITADVVHKLLDLPLIDEAVEKFNSDFSMLVGGNISMKDVL